MGHRNSVLGERERHVGKRVLSLSYRPHVSTAISDSTTAGRALLTAANAAAQNALLGTTSLGFVSGNIKETAGLLLESGWYWCDGSNKNRVTDAPLFNAITIQQTGTLNSTAVVTGLTDTANGSGNTPISPGMPVSGTNIPANTVVLSVDSGTQVTLSAAATGSGVTPLVFAPFGVGDGSTTFGIPNRAYVGVGRDNASGSASNIMQLSTTITTTLSSATATVASAVGLSIGMHISHPKVPFGTTIAAISGTTITMSNPATAAVNGSGVRFSPLGDAQTLGQVGGELSHVPTIAETVAHTHANSLTDPGHNHALSATLLGGNSGSGFSSGGTFPSQTAGTISPATTGVTIPNASIGGGLPANVTGKTIVMNYVIKR
jgi:hypothetical protein